MLKFTLIAGSMDRLNRVIDTAAYKVEVSRLDGSREEQDDSPTDEMEVIQGEKDA